MREQALLYGALAIALRAGLVWERDGHTSGINVAFVRASDAINNAQRSGDLEASQRVEDEIAAFEDIRFRDGRMYNYSAVVEAMHLVGSDAIDGGDESLFNPRVPVDVASEVPLPSNH